FDQPVEMHIDKILPRRRPPVAQQESLDVLRRQRLAEQGIVPQIDLPHGQIVRRPPVSIHLMQHLGRQWLLLYLWLGYNFHSTCFTIAAIIHSSSVGIE